SDNSADTGSLTASNISGLGMGGSGLNYANVEELTIQLGQGGDTLRVLSTQAIALTHIFANGGNDTVNIETTSGVTDIHGGTGNDIFNVGKTFDVGLATQYSSIDGIQASLTIAGDTHSTGDQMNIIETNEAAANSVPGTLTATTLTGLGMGAAGITYGTLEDLTISVGLGGDLLKVVSTHTG